MAAERRVCIGCACVHVRYLCKEGAGSSNDAQSQACRKYESGPARDNTVGYAQKKLKYSKLWQIIIFDHITMLEMYSDAYVIKKSSLMSHPVSKPVVNSE